MKNLFIAISSIFLVLSPMSNATASPIDFDSDTVSDFTLIRPEADSSLTWLFRSSAQKKLLSLGSFGALGNHITLSHWTSVSTPELGVISSGDNSSILWTIRQNSGELLQFTFGSVNDLAVSGGDLDGNGQADAVAIARAPSGLTWNVYFNPLGTASAGSFAFGDPEDIPFFVDQSSAPDSAAILRRLSKTSGNIYIRNSITGEVSSFGISSKITSPKRPFSISRDGESFIVIPQTEGKLTRFYLYNTTGNLRSKRTCSAKGDIVVGDFFTKEAGLELAVRSGKSFCVLNPFNGTTKIVRVGSGIPVDEINVNTLGTWGGGSVCEARDPSDGTKKGFVWKPNSDTQHYAVAVLPADLSGKISKVESYTASGSLIKEIGLKNCGNPDSVGPRCNYQERKYTGSDYKNLFGAIFLKVSLKSGSCLTISIPDPSKRLD